MNLKNVQNKLIKTSKEKRKQDSAIHTNNQIWFMSKIKFVNLKNVQILPFLVKRNSNVFRIKKT